MKKMTSFLLLLLSLQQMAVSQNSAHSKLQFTSTAKNRIYVDSTYYYQLSAIDSSGNAFTFAVGDLPTWLHFNKEDHSISGKPLKAGQYLVHALATAADTVVHQYFMLTVYNRATTNILILGNSITNGTNKYNSYRRPLWQMLHREHYNFDFIGSWDKHHMGGEFPNPDFDMDHDGHSGWKASDILSPPDWDKQRGSIREWIKTYTPDIVLMELGTNEVFQCIPVKEAMNNLSMIIDILRQKNPRVRIFIAQIPPLGKQWADKKLCGNDTAYSQAIRNFNKNIPALVTEKNTAGSPLALVDQYTGIHPATDMYDDIHPTDIGEKKMAERWYGAIKRYLVKL